MTLYKLLAEFDFRHFELVGLPVMNQHYITFPLGPVPEPFHSEITKKNDTVLPDDFRESLNIEDTLFENEVGKKFRGFKFLAKRKPNLDVFSSKQQDIMNDLVLIYKTATATEASDASHEHGTPWSITKKKHGLYVEISLLETVPLSKPLTKELVEEKLRERELLDLNYGG